MRNKKIKTKNVYLHIIHRSIVSKDKYSHDTVSVDEGFNSCAGLPTRLSFWSDLKL